VKFLYLNARKRNLETAFLRYSRDFVTSVIAITEFDCTLFQWYTKCYNNRFWFRGAMFISRRTEVWVETLVTSQQDLNTWDFKCTDFEVPCQSDRCCPCRWGEIMSLNCRHKWAYCSSPRYKAMECHSGLILTGETQRTRRKTCPNVTLSIVNSTWTDLGANPDSHVARVVQLNYQRFGRTSCLLIRTEMTGKLFWRGEFWEIKTVVHTCVHTYTQIDNKINLCAGTYWV
jgi:hypothetical protein